MDVDFKELNIESKEELEPYFNLREIESCEYNFNILFMWNHYYKTRYYMEDDFVIFLESVGDKYYTLMPLCKEDQFDKAFNVIFNCFKEKGVPFEMYVVDKKFASFVEENYSHLVEVTSERDYFDYLYCGDKLRTLKGKKLNKKRNHINAFYNEYEERYEYKSLDKSYRDKINSFIDEWKSTKEDRIDEINEEIIGINTILDNLDRLDIKIGGIFIDDKLEAISMGSLINHGKEAVIHVEKANDKIRGLYPIMNQIFLIHEFPNVEIVNREEDMGIEGLRKAKMSYRPIRLVEKFTILETR